LDNSDPTYQGSYSDVYRLDGLGNNEAIILHLEGFGFSHSLELINGGTGEIISQYDAIESEGTSFNEVMFSTENDIEYLVRITSIENQITGEYTLATTSGELTETLIFSDTETGVLDNSDPTYQGSYSDVYRLDGLGNNEAIILHLEGFGFSHSLELINGGTGEIISQYDAIESEGTSFNEVMFSTENDIEYLVRITSIENQITGEYTLATTSGELTETLIFSDTETGVLDNSDPTYQGRPQDEYILRGFGDQETVILNLDSAVFSGSLQLVNRETGEVIHQSQVTESDENAPVQLAFTSSSDLEYLVRVISLEETAMGSYTLGATSGQLTPGVSDQTIQGSITEDDEVYRFWGGRYSDRYDITNLSDFQTINIELTSSDYNTMLFLVNADTGRYIVPNRGSYNSEDGTYSSNITYKARADVNYAIVVSSFSRLQVGDYTLDVKTNFSVNAGFDQNDDDFHPIIRNRLMDNYLLSDVQVGEDVEINLNSGSSNNLVQLINKDTGDVLQSSNQPNLKFTVEDNIN
ncbi:hypothetical protein, partial [Crocosphaera sp.]|uniref:hypothetical protein n=1 Tax=Crocosphaera sp. TaxID=2729996 RepID=UPI00257CB80B